MRIAHIANTTSVGGAEILIALLCRMQRAAGHTVTVHVLFEAGRVGTELESEGFPVYFHHHRGALAKMRSVYKTLKHFRPDAIHCHNRAPAIIATFPGRLVGARIVCTRHGLVVPSHNNREELQFWIAARFIDYVAGVCDATCFNLMRAPLAIRSKIVRVYNGADPAAGEPNGGPLPVKTGFTVINVGRLFPPKDQVTLLSAFKIVLDKRPDARLWIVGDGPLGPFLRNHAVELGIHSKVYFLGDRTDVGSVLALSDLFVMSSVSEGLPIALLEAMAAGVPALVTEIGGMAEIVGISGAGKIVPAAQPLALAETIVEMAANPQQRQLMSNAARACYLKSFTPARMMRDYLDLYRGYRPHDSHPAIG